MKNFKIKNKDNKISHGRGNSLSALIVIHNNNKAQNYLK